MSEREERIFAIIVTMSTCANATEWEIMTSSLNHDIILKGSAGCTLVGVFAEYGMAGCEYVQMKGLSRKSLD